MGDTGRTLVTTAPVPARFVIRFDELAHRRRNFVPVSVADALADPAWRVDERRGVVGSEPPGPPAQDGVFAHARRALVDYAFADPKIVRAVYDRSVPLEGRDMLLVGRFLGLRFAMGVRAGGVEDGLAESGDVHRFRWHYDTLDGHLERGRMVYELRKSIHSGVVELRIRAYSQPAPVRSPITRLGFLLFGRMMQLRFYDRVLTRMREVVSRPTTPGGG